MRIATRGASNVAPASRVLYIAAIFIDRLPPSHRRLYNEIEIENLISKQELYGVEELMVTVENDRYKNNNNNANSIFIGLCYLLSTCILIRSNITVSHNL